MTNSNNGRNQYMGDFRLATYCTAITVTKLLSTREDVLQAVKHIKDFQIEHVFLELYRGGHAVEESILIQARDILQEAGIQVGAGLTTIWGEGFGDPALPQPDEQGDLFCYSSPRTAESISRICELAGRLFDEFILDDYFFTNCECDTCCEGKDDLPWGEFRNKLLAEFARKAVLEPAHRANPNCKVIVKFPQWYDRFHRFGYDVEAQTAQFDAIWTGTETRNPHGNSSMSFVQQAQSWCVYQWLNDLAGAKTLGGWFDQFNCDVSSYIEQAYQNALIGTPEIVLFHYESLCSQWAKPLPESLKGELPRLRRWSPALRQARPVGIACYKPPNSDGGNEPFIFDQVTMLGIPTTMHARFPQDASVIFLPTHALADPDVLAKTREHLESGGAVLASAGFVLGLDCDETSQELFGLQRRTSLDDGPTYTRWVRMGTGRYRLRKYMYVTGALRATDAEVHVSWGMSDEHAPYFTSKRHGTALAMMLDTYTSQMAARAGVNLDRLVQMLELPQDVLDTIRNTIIAPLGLTVRCPGRVGVYCFGDGPLAICNYRNEPAEVAIDVASDSPLGALDRLTAEPDSGATIQEHRPDHLKLTLPDRSRILLAAAE